MQFDWSEYESDSDTEEVSLLLSVRSQSLILAAVRTLEFRSSWKETDDSTWDDIEAAVAEAYEELMLQQLLSEQYRQRVMATSPLRFNRLSEGVGSVMFDGSGNNYTGTYSGVTWGTDESPLGEPAPFFDGVNDVGNLYSASFATAMNMDEFTITLFLKMASGAWSDATFRTAISFARDGSNLMRLIKSTASQQINFERTANGTSKQISATSQINYGWDCWQASCSVAGGGLLAAGEMELYKNGSQIGSTATGNVASVGSGYASGNVVIGGGNITPVTPHHGALSCLIIHDRAIDNDILALAKIYE